MLASLRAASFIARWHEPMPSWRLGEIDRRASAAMTAAPSDVGPAAELPFRRRPSAYAGWARPERLVHLGRSGLRRQRLLTVCEILWRSEMKTVQDHHFSTYAAVEITPFVALHSSYWKLITISEVLSAWVKSHFAIVGTVSAAVTWRYTEIRGSGASD